MLLVYVFALYQRDFGGMFAKQTSPDVLFRFSIDDHLLVETIKNHGYDTFPYPVHSVIEPFFQYSGTFEVEARYLVSMCHTGEHSLRYSSIFCFFRNPFRFRAENLLNGTNQRRMCRRVPWGANFSDSVSFRRRTKFAVVRSPIDRYLDVFAEQCRKLGAENDRRCLSCKGDLVCFTETLFTRLKTITRIGSTSFDPVISQLAPQTWYCDFDRHLAEYIIIRHEECTSGMETVMEEIDKVFQLAGVPPKVRLDALQLVAASSVTKTKNTTSARQAAEYELFTNKTLLQNVVRIYFYDFILFGFDFPELRKR